MNATTARPLRVLVVAEHASARFGGEAALPLHYFRVLERRGLPVHLLVHARTRPELRALYGDHPRIHYIEDNPFHVAMWRVGERLPHRIAYLTTGFASRLVTQFAQRRIARRLVRTERIDVVHQPIPVSPREPSALSRVGAPVVIGPMNGNMRYPEGFAPAHGAERGAVSVGRRLSTLLQRLLPGKLEAAALVVANPRTRAALPSQARGTVVELVENGVDLSLFRPPSEAAASTEASVRFVFLGRLVDWKRVDLLLHGFADARRSRPRLELEIVGDGPERASLAALAEALGLGASVRFAGWLDQTACAARLAGARALVLPSVYECGGAVVLEAMAMARPVVATAWGGPLDYLDEGCGILVPPKDEASLQRGLADAIATLADDAERAAALGRRGREKVLREFDWEVKVDRMLEIHAAALEGTLA